MARKDAISRLLLAPAALLLLSACPSPTYGVVPDELVCVEDCYPVTYTGCDMRRRCCVDITVMRPAVWWGEHTWGPCDDRAWATSDPSGLCVFVGQMCPSDVRHAADPYFGCASDREICCDVLAFEDSDWRQWPTCE